jgi:hypothetical protein
MGPNFRPLPDLERGPDLAPGPSRNAPDKRSFTNPKPDSLCVVKESVRAIKIKEDDRMVIYQDSTQWASASSRMLDANAQRLLDYYATHGEQVIETYFNGISDVDGDGQILVFVTPAITDVENAVAYVSPADFYPKTEKVRDGVIWPGCPASNEAEMMRFSHPYIQTMSDDDRFGALGTLVHEVKHISSLYKSLFRGEIHPVWVEEGTAEIADEVASRIAWAGAGGPAVGALARGSNVSEFTPENYGTVAVIAGTVLYLSSQPNGVVVTPAGAEEGHSVYGSGWHFHRWLGDAYGNAATPLGDAAFFRTLNDSVTAAGVDGILEVTGARSWGELMAEYLAAIMVNGTGAPQPQRAFTSYDFPTITGIFSFPDPDGDYPWPVNLTGEAVTGPFATSTFAGPIGPSGVRVIDLSSNGTGLGLEVKVWATGSLDSFRMVLVRVE